MVVRIDTDTGSILARPSLRAEILSVVPGGSEFDLIKREGDWFWIMTMRDANGTPHSGWVHVSETQYRHDQAVVPSPHSVAGSRKGAKADTRRLDEARQELEKARADYNALTKPSPEPAQGSAALAPETIGFAVMPQD
jgi:hypothetical protein